MIFFEVVVKRITKVKRILWPLWGAFAEVNTVVWAKCHKFLSSDCGMLQTATNVGQFLGTQNAVTFGHTNAVGMVIRTLESGHKYLGGERSIITLNDH